MKSGNNSIVKPIPAGIFALLLFPVLLAAWGRFGLKVPLGLVLSILTGLLIKVLSREQKGTSASFPWPLFFVFPLFAPLGMPLWLIPVSLIMGWLISISSFGGYGKNIFNPVAVALVFIISGYGSSVSLLASKPFPGAIDAISTWTAGINPVENVCRISAQTPVEFNWNLLAGGNLPAIPGLAFPGVLLFIAMFLGLFFPGRRTWSIATILLAFFATGVTSRVFPGMVAGPLNILFMSMTPALMIVALADQKTIPVGFGSQVLHAAIFSLFLVSFICMSEQILAVTFALLLTQVVFPFCMDILNWRADNGRS